MSEAFPLHGQDETRALGRMLRSSLLPFRGLDINKIRSYFGVCGYLFYDYCYGAEVGGGSMIVVCYYSDRFVCECCVRREFDY